MKSFVIGLVAVLLGFTAVAEGPPEFVVKGALKGADVPEFYRYQTAFQIAHQALADPDPEFRRYYLEEEVGIPAGGEAEALFAEAVKEAWTVITNGNQPDVSLDLSNEGAEAMTVTTEVVTGIKREDYESDEAFDADIQRHEREQARKLGRILGTLEAALAAKGVSTAGIHAFANERLAASLVTSEEIDADHHIWQVEHSFDVGREAAYRAGGGR